MALEVEGSNPLFHPIILKHTLTSVFFLFLLHLKCVFDRDNNLGVTDKRIDALGFVIFRNQQIYYLFFNQRGYFSKYWSCPEAFRLTFRDNISDNLVAVGKVISFFRKSCLEQLKFFLCDAF